MEQERRFLQMSEVCEQLNISPSQCYALVRSGEMRGIKVGGRGQWRVELAQLEAFIERMYAETRNFVNQHPFSGTELRDVPINRDGGTDDGTEEG